MAFCLAACFDLSRKVQFSSNSFAQGHSIVLHCASLLRTIFTSLVRAHGHVYIQNVRDFPQSKLNSEINSPFFLNEHSDPQIFFQVFAKNSQIKNIFEEEKSWTVEHDFFRNKFPTRCILPKARTSS